MISQYILKYWFQSFESTSRFSIVLSVLTYKVKDWFISSRIIAKLCNIVVGLPYRTITSHIEI
jgi:hypothetical protein